MDPKDKEVIKEKKKKKDKEDRAARIKQLEKQLEEANHQIEALKIKIQNALKDSLKLQQSHRRLQKLW
jgi:TolA-binding protein